MADRNNPYSMFSQNLTPNSLQQSQIPPPPAQSQQADPQMISALSNTEHVRMWQQMNQLQNPYRPQPSGDLTASQMNHQMPDFARGQALSHAQGQPIVQQIQQPYAPRMNPSGVFHDPQGSQSQSLMPSNFPNIPMNSQQQLKGGFTMNPMVHAAMNNPGIPRHLQMQEMARLQQSGLGSQHAPNQSPAVDMFASPSMRPPQDQMRGSSHPIAQPLVPSGANQGMVPGNQPSIQKRMMTQAEYQERKHYLLAMIAQSENTMASHLQAARNANCADPHIQQKLDRLRAEISSRRDVYTQFVATYGAMLSQQIANGLPVQSMQRVAPVPSEPQPPQQPTVSNTEVQPGFVTERVTAPYKFPTGNGPSPMPAQSQGSLNQQLPIQPIPIVRPSTIPPRTGGTPHQIPNGPLPNNMSPNMGNFTVQGGQKVDQAQQAAGIMPLEKQRFEATYAQFCRSQNININPDWRVAIGDNGVVDLHQLHVQVMREGGASSVAQRDIWAVIGGRLGFNQLPGTDTEPARCGPVIAHQLQTTYERYLQLFENAYIMTVRNRQPAGSPQPPIHQGSPNSLAMGNNVTPGISANTPEVPPNPPRSVFNSQLIATGLRYALVNAQDMRTQRVSENVIAFVERHRSELIKLYQQQLQLVTQRKVEPEQQSVTNGQAVMPNTHEQASVSLQSGVQRPPQPLGANSMVGIAGGAKMANGSLVPDGVVAALQKQPPTQEQVQQAVIAINNIRHLFQQRSLPGIAPLPVPEEQRSEYGRLLEQVYGMTSELDGKLPLYLAVFKNEELLRKYVAIVLTVARQRQLLLSSSPQYIISPLTLRNMQMQVHKLNEEFEVRRRAMKTSAVAAVANSQQGPSLTPTPARLSHVSPLPVPPMQNISQVVPPATQNNGRLTSITPQLPPPSHPQHQPPLLPQSNSHPHHHQSQLHPQHSQQQSLLQPKKNPQTSVPPSPPVLPPAATIKSPTPPATVIATTSSTPTTSAPTPQPVTSSPHTPKSPPSKKTKPSNRVNRRMSAASKGPATPEMASASVVGVKRPPEEDIAAAFANIAPSEAEVSNAPSPKKAKTEWEGEPSEALRKKLQDVDSIKTEEDAAAFMDRMKELFAMTASTDNEIQHELASTLDQILAGVAQEPADAAATAAALSVHGAGDAGPPPTALSPHLGPANDAFLEFIDFSFLEDEDNDSKAPTPDLVPSSETNQSPESGSEGDQLGSTGSPDKAKIDESSDPLRLGCLREIDGGESAYYQPGDWKWEGMMPTLDQPWAIYNS